MPTAPGFATCSYELKHASMSRSAFLTFGVDCTGTDPNATAISLVAAFSFAGSLLSCIDSNVTLQNTRVSQGTDGGEDLVGASPQVVACTMSGTSLPANCAVLVQKLTSRGGRRGRGRMYIPWAATTSGVGEDGKLVAGDVTRVTAAVQVWLPKVAELVGPVVLLHRESGPEVDPPTTPGPPNVVTSIRVDPLVATQRRRLGR